MNAKQIIKTANNRGMFSLNLNAHVHTRNDIKDKQQDWPARHKYKQFDFSAAPFWLIHGDFEGPIAITGEDDQLLIDVAESI